MIALQNLLVTVANAPHDASVFVDIAGNGKELIPVTAAELKDGSLVIVAPRRSPTRPESKAGSQTTMTAKVPAPAEKAEPTGNQPTAESLDFDASGTTPTPTN